MISHRVEDMTIRYLSADAGPADTAKFHDWLVHPDRRAIGFDTETGGVNPLDHWAPEFRVRLVGFASETEAWVLHAELTDDIRAGMALPMPYVAHNAPFDTLSVRQHFGAAPRTTIDTALAALMVFPPASALDPWFEGTDDEEIELANADDRHRLKPLSARTGSTALVDADAELHRWFAELEPRPRGGDASDAVRAWEGRCYSTAPVDDPRYWIYNGLDAIFCLRVLRWLDKRWPGSRADFRALLVNESRLDTMLTGITWRGLRVDREALGRVFFEAREAQSAMAPAFAELGVGNPASAPNRDEALRALDVVDPVLSDAGLVSTDKREGLPRLTEPDQPERVRALAVHLTDWRGHQALRLKTREIDRLVSSTTDGRLHPGINALRARTSRMSIVRPALQNLPKKDQRIRAGFIAEEGHVLVSADFSQVEYRVAAALSRDTELFRVISSGADLHDNTATLIFGPDFTPVQRGQAKNGGFAVMYGAGPKRIAATFGGDTTIGQAQEFLSGFQAAYPGLAVYIRETQRDSEIVSLSGRRTAIDPDKAYASTNYYIQGAARDLLADALLRLLDHGWGDSLWLVIHDEIILQVPEAQADDAAKALESAMNMTFRGVPITATAEVLGTRWGSLPESVEQEAGNEQTRSAA